MGPSGGEVNHAAQESFPDDLDPSPRFVPNRARARSSPLPPPQPTCVQESLNALGPLNWLSHLQFPWILTFSLA